MVGPSRPQIVMFGSSIVQYNYILEGWGAILADLYCRRADFVMRGYAGWNSTRAREIVGQVFPQDATVKPSLVILYFGGNDSTTPYPYRLGPHVPLNKYVENMEHIINHIKGLSTTTRLIVLSTPPLNEKELGENSHRSNEACKKYSDACIELCQRLDVKVIDLFHVIQQREDWENTSFTDGVHFTHEASKTVVYEILKTIKDANWEPSLYWKSMDIEFSEDSPFDHVADDGEGGVSTENSAKVIAPWQKQWDLP